VGKEIIHWPAKGIREDIVVVDLSRIADELIGVKRRPYGMPEFPDGTEYCSVWALP
jgi:hypothetical protein